MYGKIFVSIYNGTLMSQLGWFGVYVFSSMIVLADKDGIVDMDERALYRTLGFDDDEESGLISFDRFLGVLDALCSPDELSNITKLAGKRIVRLRDIPEMQSNRGYLVVNYELYRRMGNKEERNEYARGYMAAKRELSKEINKVSNVKNVLDGVSKIRHTDTDTDTDKRILLPKAEKISLSAEGEWMNLTKEKMLFWENAYPAVNVAMEIRQAAAWILANPKRRKSNYDRFLVNWLKRAQDKARPEETTTMRDAF